MTDLMCDHEAILNLVIRQTMNERGYIWRSAKWRLAKNLKRPPGSNPKFQRREKYMPQIEQKSAKRRSKENPVSTIDISGKSVDELKDALAEIQAAMRSRCLAAFGYDEAKTARLIDEFAAMSRRLENKDLTDLERLAAEQIITCWIQTTVSGYRLEGLKPGQEGGRMASFLEHRHNMAHNRLLRSMELLSRMQGLNLPGGVEPDRNLLITMKRGSDDSDRVFSSRTGPAVPGSKYDTVTVVHKGERWFPKGAAMGATDEDSDCDGRLERSDE